MIQNDCCDLKNLANAWINPLTAVYQLVRVKERQAKAAICLAGASQLSKQYYKLAQSEGYETILVVRKDEQVTLLKEELGAKHVLNQESSSFSDDLMKAITEL